MWKHIHGIIGTIDIFGKIAHDRSIDKKDQYIKGQVIYSFLNNEYMYIIIYDFLSERKTSDIFTYTSISLGTL